MIAAKFGDPVLGIDIHAVTPPPPAPPAPTPLPHPFVGVVFDPIGAAVGAAMGAVFGGGGAVIVNGMPTGNTGTEVKGIPHIPTPPGVAPHPSDAPTGNEGTLVTGSKTVDFAGSSQSRTLSSVMSCNYPINLPTSVCMAVPMGAPVLIGGPEAVDFTAAATQAVRTKWVSGKLHAATGAAKGSKRSKFICFLTGHPVDVTTGELLAEHIDAELPGIIPLVFERNYRSRETEAGLLGPAWYHFFDAYVEARDEHTALRLPDGRPAEHPLLREGASYFHKPDRYTLTRERDSYTLSMPEGLTYVFRSTVSGSSRHRLVEIRDRGRSRVVLQWQGKYLAQITDTAERPIACRYNSEGRLERLVAIEQRPEGPLEHLLAQYTYDAAGMLAAAKDPLGHAIRYAYRGGVLIREVHKGGLTFHFEWDWDHPEGWCVRTWGDAGDSDVSVMDLAPGTTPPKAIYDRRLTYDKHRRRAMVHDGRGGITYYEGNDRELVDKVIDPTGVVTQYVWDENAWKLSEEDGTGAKWEWTYDGRGNRIVEKDPLGNTTRWTYDKLDRITQIRDPKGGTWAVEYHPSSQPSTIRRPDGTATLFQRDDLGRLLASDDPMGRRVRLSWTPHHEPATSTDPEGRVTRYEYDFLGRLIAMHDPLGRTLRVTRDACGNSVYVERQDGERLVLTRDAEGNIVEQVDSLQRRVRARYAGLGCLVEHTDALGHKVRFRYDTEQDLIAVENQTGDLYTFELDKAGRVKTERTFGGTKRQFIYDKAGRCSRAWSAGFRTMSFERNALGRVTKQVSKTGALGDKPQEEFFLFDEAGSLVAAAGAAADVYLQRDVIGRIVQEKVAVSSTKLEASVSSRYDHSGFRIERRTSMAHRTTYSWNNAGELTAVSAGWDLPRRETLKKAGLPQASQIDFEIKIARDPLGQELARRLPGGVTSVWTRDAFGRPAEQRVLVGATTQSPGRDVLGRRYQWSAPDQIAALLDLQTGRGVQYEHDARGALVRQILADGTEIHRTPDPAGNLFRTAERKDRTYGRGGVIKRADGTHYKVDDDGFLVQKTLSDGATWKYTWDGHGRLREVERPDKKKVCFTYDAFGRRTTKTFEGRTIEYVWDGDDLVHERVRDADGAVASPVTTWVFEPGMFTPLAKLEGRKRFGIVTDHLGTPSMLTTEAGQIAWRAQLDVYGVVREEEGVARDEDRTANPWRFPGQYEDAETGLYYNRFRYYDPELGRYLSEDPIGLAGGIRPYAYVEDPTGWLDPLGLKSCKVDKNTKKKLLANKPPGDKWHMHHIVMEGDFSHWKPENRAIVEKSRDILKKFGIDLQGDANVVWAKNEGHSVKYAQDVYDAISKQSTKEGVQEALDEIAKKLGPAAVL